jgi:hypothetical protein
MSDQWVKCSKCPWECLRSILLPRLPSSIAFSTSTVPETTLYQSNQMPMLCIPKRPSNHLLNACVHVPLRTHILINPCNFIPSMFR